MAEIRRLPERALADRSELDAVLDAARVATLSTVSDGRPLVVPVLFARDGDRLLVAPLTVFADDQGGLGFG